MQLLDGKLLSAQIKQEITADVAAFVAEGGKTPHLVAILVGSNGASETYVASKMKNCADVGMASTLIRLEPSVTEAELLDQVRAVNNNPDMDGLIVQLPLPDHINPDRIMETIDPAKDVDGFHPINIGRMAKGLPAYISATPQGVLEMIKR
ncbi:MAG: bifunctional 5,10-methylene-tetrahydrofolate dehydrogenase/5,10-methylene-tetrahydrofolate cyclohydrolase, partial [Bacteroidetes bacterium]|nr:bifunctional 5,10-methylene-tetrahydrofolate dehydrogenase/5,10-methylene-tetrahydrofolate cyclohydrolase [Fibrella sp.]